MLRLQLLPFSLLSLLVAAGTTPIYTNTSSASTTATACNSCTVTAYENFLTYPSSVETTQVTVPVTVIPLVTIHTDGSSETNYKTVTASANVTGTYVPAGDPFAQLTWEVDGATLTYPTTYVQFVSLSGGLFTPTITAAATTCIPDVKPLQLPATFDAFDLIAPVTVSIDLSNPTGVSAPPKVMTFLNGIPAVSSQFSGTDVAKCSWTKIPVTSETHFTATGTGTSAESTEVATVNKVTVSVLTQVTAAQQVITAPSGKAADQVTTPTTPATVVPPVAHTENTDTGALVVNPTPGNNNPTTQAQQQQQATTSPDVAGNIAGILLGGSSAGGTNGNGGTQAPANTGSGSNTQGQNGGQGGTITGATAGVTATAGSSSQPGSGAAPSSLVLNIGGQQTTVAPTVIAGPQGSGSVTAFVLGPGTTLTAGGAPITIPASVIGGTTIPASVVGGTTFPATVVGGTTIPGTVVSAPKATGATAGSAVSPLVITVGGKATTIQPTVITGASGPLTAFVLGPGSTLLPGGSAIVISGTTISGSAYPGTTLSLSNVSGSTSSKSSSISKTTTGGVGGAIASGLGITSAPSAANSASHRGVDMPMWSLGAIFGCIGALAVWL